MVRNFGTIRLLRWDDFNTLSNFVSEGAILDTVNLGILPEIPSWPLALVTSSAFRCHTSYAQSIAHIIRSERVG